MSELKKILCLVATLIAFGGIVEWSYGQTARFGDSYVIPNAGIAPQVTYPPPRGAAPTYGYPGQLPFATQQPRLGPPVLPQLQNTIPAPGVAPQGFDPFAVQSPVFMAPPGSQSIQPPPYIYPPPAGQQPYLGPMPGGAPYNPYSNGSWSNAANAWPNQAWARLRGSEIYRLLERPRWRHTYLGGRGGGRQLGLNETDIATTLTIPNFLFSPQPIRISPGFAFHFWDGPDTATTGADLPARTYSSYVAFDYSTPWDRRVGAEVNFTVGVYSDFGHVTSDSIRLTGVGLGWVRLNNTTTFKLGVEYLDRIDIKLLPAGGFFLYPTSDLKLDIYFPRPKLARRLRNLGNHEIWAYIGAEYGGGSWTIDRTSGVGDQVDMNDMRAFLGFEWLGPRQVTGFFEVGYVFERELVYRSAAGIGIDLDDTYMLRAGLAF